MKATNVVVKVAALAAVTMLAACASTGPRGERSHAYRSAHDSIDHRKIAIVDHIARRKGVEVVWINWPQKRRND